MTTAQAYWLAEPGLGELRRVRLPDPGPADVLVRTLFTGISRGTELLVHRGGVPPDQYDLMRAPFQQGEFPAPVSYGYLNVGVVEQGPDHLRGRAVFCLYPHQSRYVVPADAVTPLPDGVPPRRAVLAGTVETALNAVWDAGPLIGDRVAVVGAGMVGCCVARLLARMPATEVTLVDVEPSRAATAEALGVRFATPDELLGGPQGGLPGGLPGGQGNAHDLVVHASASAAGLQTSIDLLGFEGTVLELSWYGDRRVEVGLGGAFHSRRLTIRASQVGAIAPSRRGRRSHAERLAIALDLLRDPAFDALLTGESPFVELPAVLAQMAAGGLPGLCHTIAYDGAGTDPAGTDPAATDPAATEE